MNPFSLALRNVRRNGRRSALTLTALAVGATAILLFGGYVTDTIQGLQTSTVRTYGHLQIVTRDYLDFGRGNPGRFSIRDYDSLIANIRKDPQLSPMIAEVTPVLDVEGMAGNGSHASMFIGVGVMPTGHARQLAWDGFGKGIEPRETALREIDPNAGIVGHGLAQLLSMCAMLKLEDCKTLPDAPLASDPDAAVPADIAGLGAPVAAAGAGPRSATGRPVVDLLSSSPGGMPNVVSLQVLQAERQAIQQVDGMYLAMPLGIAQRLVFGPGERAVSSIVIQVHHTDQMPAAKAALEQLLSQQQPGLEVLTFHELSPVYDQIVATYSTIFQFIACLMAAITLFSVANAVNMAISERTGEIGTLRSLGFQRSTIRAIFVSEGALLGVIGSALGAVLAVAIAFAVNHAGVRWTPPGRTQSISVVIDIFSNPWLIVLTVGGLALVASLSALLPANSAAKLDITEALRHA
jgi:putative ABC transport system permease protein